MKNMLSRSELYTLCNRHQWFTCGDTIQYNKMFDYADEPNATLEQVAFIISFCSKDVTQQDVLNVLIETQMNNLIAANEYLKEELNAR